MTKIEFSPVDSNDDDRMTSEEYWADQEEATCKCKSRKEDEYELSIECGSIEVLHTPCGKRPWFMFGDMNECIAMRPQKVMVQESTGCSGYPCYGGSCDCGAEITLKTPEGKW